MPGLVVFRRRWSVGSDDLVVPGAFLLTIHLICLITVIASLCTFEYDTNIFDVKLLFYHQIGYVIILGASLAIEIGICIISMRGSILDSDARAPINMWIYLKTAVMLFDISWLILGSIWLSRYYLDSPVNTPKQIFFAIVISSWALVFVTCITVWCTFDTAGRSWVKMKKYQRSMRETESRFNYKRSNSMNRNWRQRKVIRAYQDSWDQRCRLLFCCMGSSEQTRNSFTDIARLLSDFFRELDVVPSDVVAGLVLLRKFQRLEREAIVRQRKNGTYEFLSGVPITERTQFLALNDVKNYEFFQTVIHYMYFAQGAYGWPMYFIINRSKVCHLVPELKCFACCTGGAAPTETEVIQDNCCYCNYAALKKTLQVGDIEIVYVTYHVDVGETPFFVAIDYTQKKIVISIRGTLSMKDILTDLNAEAEVLPLNPPRDDWLGHKGMVQAAVYIKNKLQEENIIERALNKNPERNTDSFGLVVVGHSLGAGAASILAILLKPDYPSVQCFGYAPPGGLLSMPAVEYSKSFITSVVLGKDVVPRIGLYQMEALRADLINAIQRSIDPKWKTISCSIICCGCGPEPKSVLEMSGKDTHINKYQEERGTARSTSTHPTDSSIALTLHQPLYPPGRIIHIVRHHPKADEKKYDRGWRNVLKSREPVYQAIWADTTDFDEVLISPVMLQDHMPDKILAALKKVIAEASDDTSSASSNANLTSSPPHTITQHV
ncbi:inactivation no afterpotential E isoform X3 [Musca autumnalis]|uniref:inactivation no afterpotential E isoform X3 n=1 Tax=Musca autumnalis TaxID=221902 RepID=UPI003CFB4211